MKPAIRPMKKRDRKEVIEILSNIPQFTAEELSVAVELIDAYLKKSIISGYNIFVAEGDSKILGYVCYGPTPLTSGTWDLYWIAVKSDLHNMGIGRALLTFAEDQILAESGRLVLIETSSKAIYKETRRFYDGQGYVVIALIDDYYAPGDHKLIFQKKLGQYRKPCVEVFSVGQTSHN